MAYRYSIQESELDMNGMTCYVLSCQYNGREYPTDGWGGCKLDMSDLEMDKYAKCKLCKSDLDYLHEKWKYVAKKMYDGEEIPI